MSKQINKGDKVLVRYSRTDIRTATVLETPRTVYVRILDNTGCNTFVHEATIVSK
jgi:hypothetical protein